MRKNIRWIACVVALALGVSGLTGCKSTQEIALEENQDKVNISFSWWGGDSRHDYTMAAIKLFEEKYPQIDVHLQYTEWTGYDKKSAIQMAAATEADVMQINFSWLNKFSPDGNGYYDLESLTQNLDLNSYTSDELNYGRSAGVLNALPIALNSKVFLYNQDIYESMGIAIPSSWDELFAAADKMRAKGVYPLNMDTICAFMCSVAYVEQNTGKSFFDENNTMNFNKEDVQAMLAFYMELVDKKVVPYLGEQNDSMYKEGTVAGVVQWVTNAAKFEKNLLDNLGQTTIVGPIPVNAGAARTGWYVKPATMYAVSKHTEHPQESAMLLDFLVNSEEMASLQEMEKGVPVSAKAKEVLNSAGAMVGIQVDAETVINSTSTNIMSPYYENSGLQAAFESATNSMYYDGMALEEATEIAYQGMIDDLK